MNEVTVVTAFYEIQSKFPNTTYWQWIQNFCQIPCHLVVYTSPNLVERFRRLRKNYADRTLIVPKPFNELYHYQFIDKYRRQFQIDPNKRHSPELYIIWAEKVKFVSMTIDMDPFESSKFVWCDIGVLRETQFLETFKNFPQANKIVPEKMNFLLLEDFTRQDRANGGQTYGTVRLGGGIHAGDHKIWKKYEEKWDDMLQEYFSNNRFAGQDQCIMGSIYLKNPDLFQLIRPQEYGGDPWFYLLWYWSIPREETEISFSTADE